MLFNIIEIIFKSFLFIIISLYLNKIILKNKEQKRLTIKDKIKIIFYLFILISIYFISLDLISGE